MIPRFVWKNTENKWFLLLEVNPTMIEVQMISFLKKRYYLKETVILNIFVKLEVKCKEEFRVMEVWKHIDFNKKFIIKQILTIVQLTLNIPNLWYTKDHDIETQANTSW